jgi:chromate transport protein ChrA
MDFEMVTRADTTEYFKALITGLLPILLIIVTFIVWGIMKPLPFLKMTWKNWVNNVVLTLVVCMFMIHPSVTGMAAGLFNCYEIDDGEFWLYKDLNIKCWDSTH